MSHLLRERYLTDQSHRNLHSRVSAEQKYTHCREYTHIIVLQERSDSGSSVPQAAPSFLDTDMVAVSGLLSSVRDCSQQWTDRLWLCGK